MTTRYTQPALYGGLVMGVLSALPFVAAGNLCCCLWVVTGGVIAAYSLQQNEPAPITPGDGALVGLFAGVLGACVQLLVSIPVTVFVAPYERILLQRIIESAGNVPADLRNLASMPITTGMRVIALVLGFVFWLCAGAVFSTIGGLLAALIFRKPPPPTTSELESLKSQV